MAKNIEIGGRLHSRATEHVVTGADEILYEPTNGTPKKQSKVNAETYEHVANIDAALQELSPDQTEALALATDVNDLKNNVIRSDVQTLTDAQKAQALANVGISGIDSEPTAESDNLVKSGGVYEKVSQLGQDTQHIKNSTVNTSFDKDSSDIDFSDLSGNVIIRAKDGFIETKKFRASETPLESDNHDDALDFAITDKYGQAILEISKGDIRTTRFNSSEAPTSREVDTRTDMSMSDEFGAVLMQCFDGHIKTKKFNSARIDIAKVAKDTAWTWWTYPNAILTTHNYRRKLIWGFCDSTKAIGVCQKDEFGREIMKVSLAETNNADDHNNPAVIELQDGRIAVIYAKGHNEQEKIFYRISTHSGDCSSFGDEHYINAPNREGVNAMKTTYAQVFYLNGTYYLFTRVGTLTWAYTYSTDFENWSEMKVFLEAGIQYYIKVAKVSDSSTLLRFAMYSNPDYHHTEIRLGYIDVATGDIFNGSVSQEKIVGNIGENPVEYTDFDVIIPLASGKGNRMFDVATSPLDRVLIAYCVYTYDVWTDGKYYIYDNGTVSYLCDGGEPFLAGKAHNGVTFIDNKNIVVARNENGKDIIELWYLDEEWKVNELLRQEITNRPNDIKIRNIRPIVDGQQQFIIWSRGYYPGDSPTAFTDFDLDSLIYDVNSIIK